MGVSRSVAFGLYKLEYQHWDNLEPIVYTEDGDTEIEASGQRADWSQVASSFDPADFQDATQPWVIPVYTLGNVDYRDPLEFQVHKNGVIATESGTRFVVLSFSLERHGTQYHCICSRLPNAGE